MSNSKIRRAERLRKEREKPAPVVHQKLALHRLGYGEKGRLIFLVRDLHDQWSVTA